MNWDVRSFFTKHATAYRTSASHATGEDLNILSRLARPQQSDRLLDVAAGTGHTALHLRPLVASALLVDLTPAMLTEARTLASERGLEIDALVADATAIPRPDGAFTLLTCRRAAHHFPDLPAFLTEAHRLLSPGGRLAIADMTAAEAGIGLLNQLERLRDGSHDTALSPEQWQRVVTECGFRLDAMELQQEPYSLERWLSPTNSAEVDLDAIVRLMESASPEERDALGLVKDGDGWRMTKQRLVLVAQPIGF